MNEMSIKQFTLSHKHKKSPAYYHATAFTKPDNGYIAGISQRQH
jgi:hypothetical protein